MGGGRRVAFYGSPHTKEETDFIMGSEAGIRSVLGRPMAEMFRFEPAPH